jgi:hypothetical protein
MFSPIALSHVVAIQLWQRGLKKHYGWSDDWVFPTHFDATGKVLSTRQHRLKNLVAGRVCSGCNSGWMSALESAARPLILSLARGDRHVLDLTEGEAFLLTRWTVKTCVCLHLSSNYRPIIPESHIGILNQETCTLPERVFVVAHSFKPHNGFSWVQASSWEIVQTSRRFSTYADRRLRKSGHKISVMIGGLILMIAHIPLTFGYPVLWMHRHVPLYPRSGPVVWQFSKPPWPPDPLPRQYAFHIRYGFATARAPADLKRMETGNPSDSIP